MTRIKYLSVNILGIFMLEYRYLIEIPPNNLLLLLYSTTEMSDSETIKINLGKFYILI